MFAAGQKVGEIPPGQVKIRSIPTGGLYAISAGAAATLEVIIVGP